MDIKRAINQTKPFRNNHHKVIVNTLFTHGWLVAELRAYFKPFNITEKQYNILRILRGSDKPLSTSVIRGRLLDKMSDTTRVIDRMIKKGLVEKTTNENDRRLVDITISSNGSSLLEQIDSNEKSLDTLVQNITDDEAADLSNLMDKLRG